MGNQHSAPDKERERGREKEKEKEKEREKEQSNVRSTPRHEKQRSRTITATTPLPPTETKVNAEQTSYTPSDSQHNVKSSLKPQESRNNAESSSTSLNETPVKERRAQTLPIKDATEAVKNLTLEELPARPTEDEIVRNATETEPTPKFETMRVASQTSIVDEEELREPDGTTQVPLALDWNEGGAKKVAVAGTFTGWRKRVNLRKTNDGFSTILQVRPGTHRFHFLVDGEWKISDQFATAVDSEGNLLNYKEAAESDKTDDVEYWRNNSISWPEPEVVKDVWTRKIPSYLSQVPESRSYNGRYRGNDDEAIPPAVPRQLERPFLNQNHIQKDDQSVLPNPAYVVLNHLGVASSIKDNVLAVSSTNRYRQKYVTSILYKQVDEE